MNILEFVFNWILNWIIFRPDSIKKWFFKKDCPPLLTTGIYDLCIFDKHLLSLIFWLDSAHMIEKNSWNIKWLALDYHQPVIGPLELLDLWLACCWIIDHLVSSTSGHGEPMVINLGSTPQQEAKLKKRKRKTLTSLIALKSRSIEMEAPPAPIWKGDHYGTHY